VSASCYLTSNVFLFSFVADNGVLTFQRLLGDFILSDSGAAAEGYTVSESGVAYASFPTFAYEESGFFGDLAGTFFSLCGFGSKSC